MNIQKGGEKNFDDYIGKYPNVNKDLIDAFNKKIKLEDYLDKGAPVIIICLGMSVCYKHKFKEKSKKRETYEKCYEKEAELVKRDLIGWFVKCGRINYFPKRNIILIGCTFKKGFKTIRWLKFDGCQENARFIEIQDNNLIKSTAETIQTLLNNRFKVLLFGHSFGGSVCNFVANQLVKNDNLKIFTFGSLYISQKAKKEHQYNIKNYMKDKDVAFAKLTYKCLRGADGEKNLDIFNKNVNRLSFEDGQLKLWSKLKDGESKVTIEDMKLNGIYEEKKFTENEIRDIDTKLPIFTGTIGQWKIHNSYNISRRIVEIIEFLHLFFDGFPNYFECKPKTVLYFKNTTPMVNNKNSEPTQVTRVSSKRRMSSKKSMTNTISSLVREKTDSGQAPPILVEEDEQIGQLNGLKEETVVGLNRKKLKRKKTKRKKKPKKKKPSKKKK